MKKNFFLISLTIILIFFTGCQKYEEGPLISLKKPKNRLYGEWDIAKYYINGNDSTQTYRDRYTSHVSFNKGRDDASMSAYYTMENNFLGNWRFTNKDATKFLLGNNNWVDSIIVYPFNASEEVVFEIKKLTSYNLNIESNINNYDFRIELIKK